MAVEYPEVVYWFTLIQMSGLKLNLIKPIILRWCVQEGRSLADLLDLSALELTATFGLPDAAAGQLLNSKQKLQPQATQLEQWQQQGLHPIIRTDTRYPKRLIYSLSPAKQPLYLWAQGAVELLNQPAVTLLGEPGKEKSTADFIHQLMPALEQEGIGLVSGYARGLDRDTFDLMLSTPKGFAVAVLPMGLNAFGQTTSALKDAVGLGRAVLVSPFMPDTKFQERLANARNLLIDHLTLALLIPDTDDNSLARAASAIERGLPVFVKENTSGNHELLDQGALLLTDTGEVIDWVQQALVDDVMLANQEEPEPQPELAAAPLAATAPAAPTRSDEDFKLRVDDVSMLSGDEALEVLSLGGELPEVLRSRLEKRWDEDG